MYLLGFDIGSSSIKAALVDLESGQQLAVTQSPKTELDIQSKQEGWAEQEPETWWNHACLATQKLLRSTDINPKLIKGIGIAYQMHGLVLVNKQQEVLRPAIIWCDSRAVAIGEQAWTDIGQRHCLQKYLNSPGNFTASKLKWVKDHEPHIYEQIHKVMLPGDYLAMRLTGEITTTVGGLSEAILWDFEQHCPAYTIMDYYGFSRELLPDVVGTCANQGKLSIAAATDTGLAVGTPITYRAGDQPNNALALNVLEAGEVAATGGTSGVVYGVVDQPLYDEQSRVNGFAHVNHTSAHPHIGILLCINGAGIQYSWMRKQMANEGLDYTMMEQQAASIPPGSEGLRILPFGNGAERMLENKAPGAKVNNLQFNRHKRPHFYRAALEGVAFSFVYGMQILQHLGLNVAVIRVGNDNLFQSAIFSNTIAHLMGSHIEVQETTGAIGAAKAAGVAIGLYGSLREAVAGNRLVKIYEPMSKNGAYQHAYQAWQSDLKQLL